jgi:beta-galactosidase/evolved beta-galactosidase subunit alpha
LNLDYKQCGLGSGSCGPETFPQYRIQPAPFSFGLMFKGFPSAEREPEELHRSLSI